MMVKICRDTFGRGVRTVLVVLTVFDLLICFAYVPMTTYFALAFSADRDWRWAAWGIILMGVGSASHFLLMTAACVGDCLERARRREAARRQSEEARQTEAHATT